MEYSKTDQEDKEFDQIIENAKLTRVLDLSSRQLHDIPVEVFELLTLQELNVSNNSLTFISTDIKKLVALKKLDLSSNQLSSLPNALGLLRNLIDLRISFNPLPKEIKVNHFNGVLLEVLRKGYQLSQEPGLHETDRFGTTQPPMSRRLLARRNTVGAFSFRSKDDISNDKRMKVARQTTIGSFKFTSKMKIKCTKEVKEKKNQWKKKIGFLQVGDEMYARNRTYKDNKLALSGEYNSVHSASATNLRALALNNVTTGIPLERKSKEKDDKRQTVTRTYRASYNWTNTCTVRTLYIKKEERVDFYTKMAAASEISHPNVVQLIGIVKYRKKKVKFKKDPEGFSSSHAPVFIVTEFVPQGSLSEWLHSSFSDGVSLKKRLIIAKQVALGINFLHGCKPPIIHYNLKTSNILFTDSWIAKVSEYYLGNRYWKEYKNDLLSHDERILNGTPFWIAPELLRNEMHNEKVDVYSFGFLVWELMHKQIPFEAMKNTEYLEAVTKDKMRPTIADTTPQSISRLIEDCWNDDPGKRPSFTHIINSFDDLIVDCLIEDAIGRHIWKTEFRGQESVTWKEFLSGLFGFYKAPLKEYEAMLKSTHDIIIDSDGVVTIENFAKTTQWFGPLSPSELNLITNIHTLQTKMWFHGNLSSLQAEDILSEKTKGTFLVRFSASNPGSYAISVNTDDSVKHYKIWHEPGGVYSLGTEEYSTLDDLLSDRQELLALRFPCPKGERYSDSSFWLTSFVENEQRTVVSLKKLCFRFLYRNQHLFPMLKQVIPVDLIEEFYSTIIDSITSDELGRLLWKKNFLGKDSIPYVEFAVVFFEFLKLEIEPNSFSYRLLHAITKDISDTGDDVVSIETFSKLMEWFGPMESHMLEKIREIVTKEWFHGNLSHQQAEKLIQRNSNAKKGTFLIRFSSKNRGYFTITVVGRKKSLLHYRVYYNRTTLEYIMGKRVFKSLDDILRTYHRELCLRTPCCGSKFQILQSVVNCNTSILSVENENSYETPVI